MVGTDHGTAGVVLRFAMSSPFQLNVATAAIADESAVAWTTAMTRRDRDGTIDHLTGQRTGAITSRLLVLNLTDRPRRNENPTPSDVRAGHRERDAPTEDHESRGRSKL